MNWHKIRWVLSQEYMLLCIMAAGYILLGISAALVFGAIHAVDAPRAVRWFQGFMFGFSLYYMMRVTLSAVKILKSAGRLYDLKKRCGEL